jgi:hypothetical protein
MTRTARIALTCLMIYLAVLVALLVVRFVRTV